MSYRIEIDRNAYKALKRLPKTTINRITKAIDGLAENPFPHGYKKLQGTADTYRIRVGDYRIIYTVEHNILVIYIIRIGPRKDVYEFIIL